MVSRSNRNGSRALGVPNGANGNRVKLHRTSRRKLSRIRTTFLVESPINTSANSTRSTRSMRKPVPLSRMRIRSPGGIVCGRCSRKISSRYVPGTVGTNSNRTRSSPFLAASSFTGVITRNGASHVSVTTYVLPSGRLSTRTSRSSAEPMADGGKSNRTVLIG